MPQPGRAIIHVDMDAFFASVEIRERPELADQPVVVGGSAEGRGVVAAANYIARRYGVHSAMPTALAHRLCPQAVFLPPRHRLYAEVSQQIRAVFERYTPLVEPLSLDEAFLDVTASLQLFGDAERIGRAIKAAIREELGLVASVGVAPNKFLAKLASDIDKPDGFCIVTEAEKQAFLDPLSIGRLWGVGKVTAQSFERLGIRTIGQLRQYSLRLLRQHLGNGAEHLWELAHGTDARPVVPDQEAKSISHETTFARDLDDPQVLLAWLLEMTEQVGARLRRHGLKGRTVQLKVRLADFSTLSRSQTLAEATDVTDELWRVTRELFEQRIPQRRAVRLVGMGVSGLERPQQRVQQSLLEDHARQRQSQLDAVADRIRERFGDGALARAGIRKRGAD